MDSKEILDKVREVITPIFAEKNHELVDIIYRRESGKMVLRLLVDKPGGINVEECSQINEILGTKLDELDIIPERYTLEVSSPGLDRPLKNESDFKRVRNQKVRIGLTQPQKGKYELKGTVIDADRDKILLELENEATLEITYQQIKYAKLEIEI